MSLPVRHGGKRDERVAVSLVGHPSSRKRWGRVLILVGVSAWVRCAIIAHGMRREVPVYPFLTVHPLGVIPGLLLRCWEALRGIGLTPGHRSRSAE